MTLIDLVKATNSVPNSFLTESGQLVELFVRKRTGNKGYISTLWCMDNGVMEHIFAYGEGNTIELSKEDLKNKLLKDIGQTVQS